MREGNKLTALEVSKKKRGRYSDGHGLWLQISESGTKAWLFRYMLNGRARHMGLGPVHTVNLAEARMRARQARQLILDGKDPGQVCGTRDLALQGQHVVQGRGAAVH